MWQYVGILLALFALTAVINLGAMFTMFMSPVATIALAIGGVFVIGLVWTVIRLMSASAQQDKTDQVNAAAPEVQAEEDGMPPMN